MADFGVEEAITNCFKMIALAATTALQKQDQRDNAVEVIEAQVECIREFKAMDT